ncbi:MAG: TIGR03905 family TSCPD domain-containing protein [Oscillospiraceae bacterium]
MKTLHYRTHGICSREIIVQVEGSTITNVQFIGGCSGNTQGVAALIKGMNIDEAISRIKNIDCNGKGTSCPAQLAEALLQIKNS